MNTVKFTAAGAKRFYAVKLDQLKKQDNVKDSDSRPGLLQSDGFQAAYLESDDSFAYVSRQGSKLDYGVYTPDGPVQAGTIDPQGESFLESNLRASGVSSGRHSDYEEVTGYTVADDRTKVFAERMGSTFSAALDEAFTTGQLSANLLK